MTTVWDTRAIVNNVARLEYLEAGLPDALEPGAPLVQLVDLSQWLPTDQKRQLPIPLVNQHNGQTDFAVLDGNMSLQLGRSRCCALCGRTMERWVAFVGGAQSAVQRSYADGPMHPECAVTAMTLCPHIVRAGMRRAKTTVHQAGAPKGWVEAKPETWVLLVVEQYLIRMHDGAVIYQPERFGLERAFQYGLDDRLHEVSE